MENCYLIVGLGNPGADYVSTRHNIGFMAVERLGERWGGRWTFERKFKARLARMEVKERQTLVCEPQTYMNLSGIAVQAITEYYKVALGRLLVVVDDADLPLGEIRMRASGSSGGHHGLESIEQHLATRNYPRLRLGIGRQASQSREITGHVLGRFGAVEFEVVKTVIERAVDQMECWLTTGIQRAMSEFNGTVKPPVEKES
ncbi:MAG: aminoacyl-tRNA hydrolase [Verrucomicrobia bacterium]|nr:aminoacyl-tRNA hydrolase [Verrucomicrobiota bacterium]